MKDNLTAREVKDKEVCVGLFDVMIEYIKKIIEANDKEMIKELLKKPKDL
jgi:hypothetical protein